jgi:hypothetical protein
MTKVSSSLRTSLAAWSGIATQVLPSNGSLVWNTGPASRKRA